MRLRHPPLVPWNRWDALEVPEIGDWKPTLPVTVVIPAYNCQRTLDLTLASLSAQTYPSDLLEVVVVDDGSDPPIEIPKLAPRNCRVVRVAGGDAGAWGRANSLHVGALHSEGAILHWLDADMVVYPEHIEAQARWHHVVPYAVTLGYKRFVTGEWSTTPEEVAERCADGTIGDLFAIEDTEPHDYVEELIRQTNDLRDGDHLSFRVHVGATAALRREMYDATGGFNTALRLGEDTEFGYRLMQAGALFVPEPAAKSWHLGPSHMMRHGDQLRRYNWPHLADHMPHPRWLRNVGGRVWAVPLVTAVVSVGDAPLELVRTCVDSLLAGDEHDLRVLLVGRWSELTDERRSILNDPLLDLRLIAATYRSEPRVTMVEKAPDTVFPSPYRLELPVTVAVAASTVRRLVEEADKWRVGLLNVVLPGTQATAAVRLVRTAATSRVRFLGAGAGDAWDAVATTFGQRWVSGVDFGLTDLSHRPLSELRSPRPWRAVDGQGTTRRAARRRAASAEVVPVGGVRSLLRAALFVGRLAVRRGWRLVRAATGRAGRTRRE